MAYASRWPWLVTSIFSEFTTQLCKLDLDGTIWIGTHTKSDFKLLASTKLTRSVDSITTTMLMKMIYATVHKTDRVFLVTDESILVCSAYHDAPTGEIRGHNSPGTRRPPTVYVRSPAPWQVMEPLVGQRSKIGNPKRKTPDCLFGRTHSSKYLTDVNLLVKAIDIGVPFF